MSVDLAIAHNDLPQEFHLSENEPGIPWKLNRTARQLTLDTGQSRHPEFLSTRSCNLVLIRGDVLLRKEVIQPQVLLQLPCYDFTPITNHTLGGCLPEGLAHRLLVQPTFVM